MEKSLTRSISDKMIAGVAAGLGNYLGIDSTVARLLFVLATFFHGSGLLVYIVLWIAMPAQSQAEYLENTGSAQPQNPVNPSAKAGETPGSRSAAIIGWILVGLGVFFLMDEFMYPWFHDLFYWMNIRRVWPIIFVIVGILIISSANKKKENGQDPGEKPPFPGKGPDPVSPPPADPASPPPTDPTSPPPASPPPTSPPPRTSTPPTPGVPRPFDDPGPSAPGKPDDPNAKS